MPLYDYACAICGPFRDWRRMSLSDRRAPCPSCGALSKRLPAMPFLPGLSRNVRIAHERNERSAEEPRVMRREDWRAAGGGLGGHRHRRTFGRHRAH